MRFNKVNVHSKSPMMIMSSTYRKIRVGPWAKKETKHRIMITAKN
jgi:hypothetical protein